MNSIIVDDFQKKNIHIIENVSPTNIIDVISASFGVNNISNKLQISLGNKEEKVVAIESIILSLKSSAETVPVVAKNLSVKVVLP